eukprot:2063509-Prymnesium_polylepis.1
MHAVTPWGEPAAVRRGRNGRSDGSPYQCQLLGTTTPQTVVVNFWKHGGFTVAVSLGGRKAPT